MDPTKLVLHFSNFSVILYAIYKFQPKLKYYLSCDFADRPLIPFDSYAEAPTLQLAPWKETQPCNVTPMGAVAGAVGQNPARSAGVSAGEGREEGQGSLASRFLAGVQVGAAPGVGRVGGPRWRTRQHRRR
jgi:hypothetical protein